MVALPDVEVQWVVTRRYLQSPGAELRGDGRVAHHRNTPAHDGKGCPAAQQVLVAGVLGVDGHPGISQHRLRGG